MLPITAALTVFSFNLGVREFLLNTLYTYLTYGEGAHIS